MRRRSPTIPSSIGSSGGGRGPPEVPGGQLARSLASKLIAYSTGRATRGSDREALEAIVAKDQGLRSLNHEIVRSDLFRNK